MNPHQHDPPLGRISGVTSTGSPAALPAVEWGGRAATLATYLQDKSARGGSSGEPPPAGCGTYPPARRRRATSRLSFCARPNRRSSARTPHSSLRPSSDGAPSSAWRRAGSPRPGWPQPPSAARRSAEPRASPALLDEWLEWAARSRLTPFVKLGRTIRKHAEGILAYLDTKMTNGPVEGINNKAAGDRASRLWLPLAWRVDLDAVPLLWRHRTGAAPTHTRLRRL